MGIFIINFGNKMITYISCSCSIRRTIPNIYSVICISKIIYFIFIDKSYSGPIPTLAPPQKPLNFFLWAHYSLCVLPLKNQHQEIVSLYFNFRNYYSNRILLHLSKIFLAISNSFSSEEIYKPLYASLNIFFIFSFKFLIVLFFKNSF